MIRSLGGLHSTTGKFTQLLKSYSPKGLIFCGKSPKRPLHRKKQWAKVEVVCFPGEPKREFWLSAFTETGKKGCAGYRGFLKFFRVDKNELNRKDRNRDARRTRTSLRPLRLYCDPCGSVPPVPFFYPNFSTPGNAQCPAAAFLQTK
jgi:hypothetical protein